MERVGNDKHRDKDPVVEATLKALKPDKNGFGLLSPLDDLSKRRMTDRIFEKFDRSQMTTAVVQKVNRRIALAVAVIGCIAVGTFLSLSFVEIDKKPTAQETAPNGNRIFSPKTIPNVEMATIPGGQFSRLDGVVTSGGKPVAKGDTIMSAQRILTGEGTVAMTLPTGIAVGLSSASAARVIWDGNEQYGISLMRGMALISVDPTQKRDGFFVDTPAGTARVKGTLFTVTIDPKVGVHVAVHRGQIEVEKHDGSTQLLTKPGSVVQLSGNKKGMQAVKDQINSQLQDLRCISDLTLFTELAHFECKKIKEPDTPPSRDTLKRTQSEGSRFAKALTIRDLMNLARSQKVDRNWRAATATYKELIRNYPTSDEAKTSLVSLGEIQLKHLNRPKTALRYFSQYLKTSGPLAQEALFGKAQAFRAMDSTNDEKRTLERFLHTYPNGIHAGPAKRRLNTLKQQL